MFPGHLCRGCLVAGLAVGLVAPLRAAPTSLGDAPAAVEVPAPRSVADDASILPPAASAPRSRTDFLRQESDSAPLPIQPKQEVSVRDVDPSARVSGSAGDGFSVRQLAKSARDWMHDLVPWGSPPPAAAPQPAGVGAASDLALPVEAGSASGGFAVHAERTPPKLDAANAARSGRGESTSTNVAPGMSSPSLLGVDPEADTFLRRAVRFGRGLFGHPLTWLAIVVIAVAQILLTRSSRRR